MDQRSDEVAQDRTRYRAGQVVGGHVRTEDGAWVALADVPPTNSRTDGYWSRFGRRFGWVLLVLGCLLLFLVVAMAGPIDGLMWLPMLAIEAFVLVALPVGLIVAAFPGRARKDDA